MAWLQQQQQIILRLPEDLARLARKTIYKDKTKTNTAFSVRPLDEAAPSNDFIFTLNDQDYPALLMNLPTLLESHKTFDNKIFIKSGDIGQVLQVFHTIEDKETARSNICKTVHGDYMPNGITPPTHDIVRRKFEKTRRNEGDFIPYRIRQIAQEINDFGNGTGRFINPTTGVTINEEDINQNNTNNSSSGSGSSGVEVMQEFVNEEVVDFEEWMADHSSASEEWMAHHHSSGYDEQQYSSSSYQPQGVSLTFNSNQLLSSRELLTQNTKEAQMLMLLLQHPEVLVTEEEREEDDIDALAAEQNKEKRNRELSLNNAAAAVTTTGISSTTTTATTGAMDVEASDAGVPTATTIATATTSNSANSSEPLKLSLNMLRNPATTTAATSTSNTNNIVRLQVADNADEDMAQDDEGDEEETELNGETENMHEHEEVENESDGEDYDSKEGDQEDDGEGLVTNRTGDVYIGSSGSGVSMGMDMYGSNSGTATTMYAPPVEVEEVVVEEGGSNNDHDDVVGAEEVKGDDESSVNSSDSDAWMNEV